jgi:hypothetical protein
LDIALGDLGGILIWGITLNQETVSKILPMGLEAGHGIGVVRIGAKILERRHPMYTVADANHGVLFKLEGSGNLGYPRYG